MAEGENPNIATAENGVPQVDQITADKGLAKCDKGNGNEEKKQSGGRECASTEISNNCNDGLVDNCVPLSLPVPTPLPVPIPDSTFTPTVTPTTSKDSKTCNDGVAASVTVTIGASGKGHGNKKKSDSSGQTVLLQSPQRIPSRVLKDATTVQMALLLALPPQLPTTGLFMVIKRSQTLV